MSTPDLGFMHRSHAIPPAEDQGSRTAARGVTRGSKATAGERSVMAFSSAPVEEERREAGEMERKSYSWHSSSVLKHTSHFSLKIWPLGYWQCLSDAHKSYTITWKSIFWPSMSAPESSCAYRFVWGSYVHCIWFAGIRKVLWHQYAGGSRIFQEKWDI